MRTPFEGRILGRYQVLEPLGHGGMAWVYRAYHPQLDRYVAIKLLRSELTGDEEFLARFRREAQAVASLRHPHIIQVFDFDVEDDVYYMVMELLEGDTLKSRLADYRVRGESMPWGESARIMLDVLAGLAYAHSEGMIHRDLKPTNILLTKRGQAVLGDFGIAHMVGGTQYTRTGALMGTPEYMAPEQGMYGQADTRSDIYALGVVLYEMLTQRIPFEAETPLALLMKHVNDPLAPPTTINPAIPAPFERIVLEAMAKQPDDRYQDAGAMSSAIEAAVAEAGLTLPQRVSQPLTFRTPEAPAEPVAVISRATSRQALDRSISDAETDITLRRLRPSAPDATSDMVPATPALSARDTGQSAVGRPGELPQGDVAHAIFLALGVVALGNLLGVTLSSVTRNWAIFQIGWPMELLLVGGALFILMAISQSIWVSIPASVITANGLVLTYCAFSGNWHHWTFLWVIEPWVVAGSVLVSRLLAREPANAHKISHLVGWAGGLTTLIAALAAQGEALVLGLTGNLLPWFR